MVFLYKKIVNLIVFEKKLRCCASEEKYVRQKTKGLKILFLEAALLSFVSFKWKYN